MARSERLTHGTNGSYRFGCRCDECKAFKAAQAKRYYESNKAKVLKSQSRRYQANAERILEEQKAYRASNAEQISERNKRRYEDNREIVLAKQRDSYQRDPRVKRERGRMFNLKTEGTAHRKGVQWTGPELEIASRADLSVTEIAELLGRTYCAVVSKRKALKVDPRAVALAGNVPDPMPGTVALPGELVTRT